MAVNFADVLVDGGPDKLITADIVFLLAAAETTYSGMSTNKLASSAITGSNFAKADFDDTGTGGTTGRKVTFTGPTGVTPDADGTGAYIGFGISGSSTFLGTISLSATVDVLTSGTVNFGTSVVKYKDPIVE